MKEGCEAKGLREEVKSRIEMRGKEWKRRLRRIDGCDWESTREGGNRERL